jgi:hypothetical protein
VNKDLKPSVKGLTIVSGDGNPLDVFAVQKARAIAHWEEAYAKKYFDCRNTYKDVLDKLNVGEVLPIYHTLCLDPAKRLFLPNTFVSDGNMHSGTIEISATHSSDYLVAPVQVGQGTSLESTNKAIWKKNDFSYLDAFFDKDRQAISNVWDIRFKDYWEFDEEITSIVTDLVNSSAKMVGHDLEVTKLPSAIPVDLLNGKNLITRNLSRGVVADCFEHSKPGSNYAIVGSPGIGKSWSLIYALQQALLFENACVMFCFQKLGICWVCIRKEHHIYVWMIESDKFQNNFASGLFRNRNVLALLDPRESGNNKGAEFTTGNYRRLIFAASNNESHFSNMVGKTTGHALRILNPFSDNEIKVALPFFDNIQSDTERYTNVIMERAKVVGNLPRYLIDDTKFDDRKKNQNTFMKNVARKKVDLESVLSWSGMSEKKGSVPGTVYGVYIRETNFGDDSPADVGYDGNLVKNYWDMAICPLTPMVRGEILKKWRRHILSYYTKSGAEEHSEMGLSVEELFWEDLKSGVILKCWKINGVNKNTDFLLFNTASGAFYNFDILDEEDSFANAKQNLPLCTIITNATIQDLATKVFFSEHRTACRMMQCGKTVDVATNNKNVFQVKVNVKHEFAFNGMRDLLLAAGFLRIGKNGLCEKCSAENDDLQYFWVVPYSNRHSWCRKKQVQKLLYDSTQPPDDYDIVFSCFREHVKEFVVFMENKPHYND